MKNSKFYPKRLAIFLFVIMGLPMLMAYVLDVHLPTGEEMEMMKELDNYSEPDDNATEDAKTHSHIITQEEKDFEQQRVYDQCNGVDDDKLLKGG